MSAIIVHGGAGTVEDERRAACVAGCEAAARAGWLLLQSGGSALDAVEAAVRALEDDAEFNAGYGSVLNRMGIVEVDACIMDGALRAGAVAAVPWMRHPVSLARHLLEREEHVLLVGGGALLYAREHGLPAGEPPDSMISPRARLRHEGKIPGAAPGGTVGACAVDDRGHVAAATSTGGTPGKRPGRVGDTPLVGAGNLADDEAGAASATGHGEAILRVGMTHFAVDLLRAGRSPEDAARAVVAEVRRRTGHDVGIILAGRDGALGHFSGTPRMPWAAVRDGQSSSGAEHAWIRDALDGELDALAAAVVAQPLLVHYGTTAPGLARHLHAALARGDGLIVAEEEGSARGFAWFLPTGTFSTGAYLKLIALIPGTESRGLGAALLDEVERRVVKSGALFLLVSHWNDGARRFYAARGYAEVGRLPAFVRADTDEIVCMKKLTV